MKHRERGTLLIGLLANGPDSKNGLLDEGVVFPFGKRRYVRVNDVRIDKMFEEHVGPHPVFFKEDIGARPSVMAFQTAHGSGVTPSSLCRFLHLVEFFDFILVNHLRPRWNGVWFTFADVLVVLCPPTLLYEGSMIDLFRAVVIVSTYSF